MWKVMGLQEQETQVSSDIPARQFLCIIECIIHV